MFASLPWPKFWSSISHTSLWPVWQYTLSLSQWKLQGRRKNSLFLLIQSLLRTRWHISSNFSYFISLFWGFLVLKHHITLIHLLLGALKAHAALKQLNSDNKNQSQLGSFSPLSLGLATLHATAEPLGDLAVSISTSHGRCYLKSLAMTCLSKNLNMSQMGYKQHQIWLIKRQYFSSTHLCLKCSWRCIARSVAVVIHDAMQ